MADLGYVVNTKDLPEAKEFELIPAGKYTVMVTNTKLLPTNDTKELMKQAGYEDYEQYRKVNPTASGMLNFEFDIQDGGKTAGRKLFHNLNLINSNADASRIAAGQLRQILEAVGIETFSGKSEELHHKRLGVEVEIREGKPYTKNGVTYPARPQNNCKKFFAPGAVSAVSSASAPVAASGAGKAPWAR